MPVGYKGTLDNATYESVRLSTVRYYDVRTHTGGRLVARTWNPRNGYTLASGGRYSSWGVGGRGASRFASSLGQSHHREVTAKRRNRAIIITIIMAMACFTRSSECSGGASRPVERPHVCCGRETRCKLSKG